MTNPDIETLRATLADYEKLARAFSNYLPTNMVNAGKPAPELINQIRKEEREKALDEEKMTCFGVEEAQRVAKPVTDNEIEKYRTYLESIRYEVLHELNKKGVDVNNIKIGVREGTKLYHVVQNACEVVKTFRERADAEQYAELHNNYDRTNRCMIVESCVSSVKSADGMSFKEVCLSMSVLTALIVMLLKLVSFVHPLPFDPTWAVGLFGLSPLVYFIVKD